MAEDNTDMVTQQQPQQRHPNPLDNLLAHFQNFKLQIPQFNKQTNPDVVVVEEELSAEDFSTQKPAVVRFPERRKAPETIRLHDEEDENLEVTKNQKSPAVMWQIYAVGAYVLARWAWSQWQKRKDLKKPSDDDQNDN